MSRIGASPDVSVIIPMRNEEAFIGKCLESVLAGSYPEAALEVLVVDGMSTDRSTAIVEDLRKVYPRLKLLSNPQKTAPAAMNVGLRHAKGSIIVRMDAHATYASDYIGHCVRLLQSRDAANVGGAQNAVGTDFVSEAIALATTCSFGIGDAQYRFSTKEQWVDTVFLGSWKKETLEALGGFNEEWIVNQDYELNVRIRKAGGKILFSPEIKCKYFVRPALSKLARQYFRYGYWKVKTLRAYPESARWRQLVPPLFALALIASLLSIPFAPALAWTVPAAYMIADLAASLRTGGRHGWKYAALLPIIFLLLHLSWGAGFWCGVLRFGFPRFTLRNFVDSVKPLALSGVIFAAAGVSASPLRERTPSVHMIGGCRLFPPDDPWNTDVSRQAVDPKSDAIIDFVAAHEKETRFNAWSTGSAELGFAYNIAASSQPMVPLYNKLPYHRWANPWGPVPAHPLFQSSSRLNPESGDRHLLIVQEGACRLYESYSTGWDSARGGWTADSQAIWDLSRPSFPDQRIRQGLPSADASGMPMTQGIIDYEELAEGAISHALRFQMPNTTISSEHFVPPATDAGAKLLGVPDPNALMYGTRLRLKANFDFSKLKTAQGRIIATALQRYGMFLADGACCNSLSLFRDSRIDKALGRDILEIRIADFEVLRLPPPVKY